MWLRENRYPVIADDTRQSRTKKAGFNHNPLLCVYLLPSHIFSLRKACTTSVIINYLFNRYVLFISWMVVGS